MPRPIANPAGVRGRRHHDNPSPAASAQSGAASKMTLRRLPAVAGEVTEDAERVGPERLPQLQDHDRPPHAAGIPESKWERHRRRGRARNDEDRQCRATIFFGPAKPRRQHQRNREVLLDRDQKSESHTSQCPGAADTSANDRHSSSPRTLSDPPSR